MTNQQPQAPANRRNPLKATFAAVAVALALLVVAVLPAEYGIDPTGIGQRLGLTSLNQPGSTRTLVISDVTGGNEGFREVELPDDGEPVPLPNPNVYQQADTAPGQQEIIVEIPAGKATEIKLLLQVGKMVLFDWRVEGTPGLYVDFHGHEQGDTEYWVRYREQEEGIGGAGSLVAPFSGEHGWYFLNYELTPVTVTLRVTGYYDEIIEYGIL